MSPDIIYEDSSIIVINKPAGLATQSANVSQPDCVSLLKEHIRKNDPNLKGEPYIGVIHRLDQPVAGLLVFAKDKKAAADLSEQVRGRLLNKYYTALVEGIVDAPEEMLLSDRIIKDAGSGKALIVNGQGADPKSQEATLYYRTENIIPDRNMTILSIRLMTGRFHQIRAQLSNMGHPIVGDRKYGAGSAYPQGIALVANRLEFEHPVTGEKVEKVVDFSFFL